MSDPKLEDCIRAAEGVATAFYEWGRRFYGAIEPILREWEPVLLEFAQRGYEAELYYPKGAEEWDVFV